MTELIKNALSSSGLRTPIALVGDDMLPTTEVGFANRPRLVLGLPDDDALLESIIYHG
jgi:hypothetical protein